MDILNQDNFLSKWFYKNPAKNIIIDGSAQISREPKDKPYSYKLNKDGLRSIDFDSHPDIITLGCSMTFGTGLPIENTWPKLLEEILLQEGLDYSVGTIAYDGGSIMLAVSSLLSILNKYQYKPKYILCNFPGIDRYSFVNSNAESIVYGSSFAHPIKKIKSLYPHQWFDLIPHEWSYFINFEYIKILEEYCRSNKIELVWSTWTRFSHMDKDFEELCEKGFSNYKKDITRDIFPMMHTGELSPKTHKDYEMFDWQSIRCHEDTLNNVGEALFNCAYDSLGNHFLPHWGIHRQIHWAEFYRSFIKE